jgi:threonine aldolase
MPLELPWTVAPGIPAEADLHALANEEPANPEYWELNLCLICLENSHNHGGGYLIERRLNDALIRTAHANRWAVHLDGARVWHSAAAQGISPAEAIGDADSVTVCFSKGLGAPVGSVLSGSGPFIARARRWRKALGGGLRQSGVLAAAALVALDEELPRIDQDRIRAGQLAAGLRRLGLDAPEPETNIVMVQPPAGSGLAARDLAAAWQRVGLGCFTMGPAVRLVTHRDIDDAAISLALELVASATPQ